MPVGREDKEPQGAGPPRRQRADEERESIWSVPRRLLRWYVGIFLVEYLIFLGLTLWDEAVSKAGEGVVATILAAHRGMSDNLLHIAGSAYVIVEVSMLADWLREITERKEREKAARQAAADPAAAPVAAAPAAPPPDPVAAAARAAAKEAVQAARAEIAEQVRSELRAERERERAEAEAARARAETRAWYEQVKDQLPPGTPPPPGIDA